jgi:tetratricopeptide (TPR) repeat protein
VLQGLAVPYQGKGEHDKALPLYQEALEIARTLPAEHKDVLANSLNNMGAVLISLGRLAEATPLCQEALRITRELPAGSPGLMSAVNNLATLYDRSNDIDAAVPLYEEYLKFVLNQKEQDHAAVITALGNLGHAHLTLGNLEAAYPMFEQALERAEELPGQHPLRATALSNKAMLLQTDGDHKVEGRPCLVCVALTDHD